MHVCYVLWERDISNAHLLYWSLIHWKTRKQAAGGNPSVACENIVCQDEARQLNRLEVKRENLPDQDSGQSLAISENVREAINFTPESSVIEARLGRVVEK